MRSKANVKRHPIAAGEDVSGAGEPAAGVRDPADPQAPQHHPCHAHL